MQRRAGKRGGRGESVKDRVSGREAGKRRKEGQGRVDGGDGGER